MLEDNETQGGTTNSRQKSTQGHQVREYIRRGKSQEWVEAGEQEGGSVEYTHTAFTLTPRQPPAVLLEDVT